AAAQRRQNDSSVFLAIMVAAAVESESSLTDGDAGALLLQDISEWDEVFRFDRLEAVERAAHAAAAAAFGAFVARGDWTASAAAAFQAAGKQIAFMAAFSTVAGAKGSATVRDADAFAAKFASAAALQELVGNNSPISFFIFDLLFAAILFASKAKAANQAAFAAAAELAAESLFVRLPSLHQVSFFALAGFAAVAAHRHMNGYGSHTFKLVAKDGSVYCSKFWYKADQGQAAEVWKDAEEVAAEDVDYFRDLNFQAEAAGRYPLWELASQVMTFSDFEIDPFNENIPTKVVPRESVPLIVDAELLLNRNPLNMFAEVEQVFMDVAAASKGADEVEDPLIQRQFAYIDTHLSELTASYGIPVCRPYATVLNDQEDGARYDDVQDVLVIAPNAFSASAVEVQIPAAAAFNLAAARVAAAGDVRVNAVVEADQRKQSRQFWASDVNAQKKRLVDAFRMEVASAVSASIQVDVTVEFSFVAAAAAARIAAAVGSAAAGALANRRQIKVIASLAVLAKADAKVRQKNALESSSQAVAVDAKAAAQDIVDSSDAANVVTVAREFAVLPQTAAADAAEFVAAASAKAFSSFPAMEVISVAAAAGAVAEPARASLDLNMAMFFSRIVASRGAAANAIAALVKASRDGVFVAAVLAKAAANNRAAEAIFKFEVRQAVDA
uniref:Catalase n=1 Tax=Penicillium janthinellum TaxID=5079 RepID=CATA_PENJA|nr:RecName: Full=Catalase [Penicillium janthinellum]